MDYSNLNDNKITVIAGISNGLIGKGRTRGSISQENISKILIAFPDLDANWLLTGKGEMLLESKQENVFDDTYKDKYLKSLEKNEILHDRIYELEELLRKNAAAVIA